MKASNVLCLFMGALCGILACTYTEARKAKVIEDYQSGISTYDQGVDDALEMILLIDLEHALKNIHSTWGEKAVETRKRLLGRSESIYDIPYEKRNIEQIKV